MKKFNRTEKTKIIDLLDYLPTKGPVDLVSPDYELSYLEFWGTENNKIPQTPYNIFFGLNVGEGQRYLINKHSLKSRKFIGNTTMDPQLALLMANLGKVDGSSLVFDPFVGTGSLLLAAAEFKGHVFGGDIDFLQLHARTRSTRAGEKIRGDDESMVANFQQYGLSSQYGDVIACDFSKQPLWRSGVQFDVIVTDPPYGIREQMTKVGTEKDYSNSSIPEEYLKTHVPEKVSYSLENILEDLVNFSAECLRVGGRLVYWIPVIRQSYQRSMLPSHPALDILYDCEQVLSSHTSRRLVVMQKMCESVGKATVHAEMTRFKDQFYIPLAGNISRRERKERIKQFGHLNFSQTEMELLEESAKLRSKEKKSY